MKDVLIVLIKLRIQQINNFQFYLIDKLNFLGNIHIPRTMIVSKVTRTYLHVFLNCNIKYYNDNKQIQYCVKKMCSFHKTLSPHLL